MPDLHTEMQKILQAWEQPETTETTKETTVFKPTNNVTQATFNFVRDNSGCARTDAIRILVAQGHKKSSVSSLIGQILRQGHIYKDSDGLLRPNAKEYTPIKSSKTIAKREAKAKKPKSYKVITSKAETKGIDAWVATPVTTDRVQEIMNSISLPEAKRLYNSLSTYFNVL